MKWEDRDASELSKAELQAASQERSEFERETAHRIDATLVVPGGYDLQAIASFVPSEIGQMVASLKVSTTSEAIQSLKLLEGHNSNFKPDPNFNPDPNPNPNLNPNPKQTLTLTLIA